VVAEVRGPSGLPPADVLLVVAGTLYLAAAAMIPIRLEMTAVSVPRALVDVPVRLLLFGLLWEAWRAQRDRAHAPTSA
jgi:hypothetical protein